VAEIKKIADVGWNDFVIENLEEALERARKVNSDFTNMRTCDGAGCGRMFDGTDPRSRSHPHTDGLTYHFCPGCELEGQAKDAARAVET